MQWEKTMNPDQIKQDWLSRGYSFGVFRDPPGQVWADFVHKTDELVVLAEGEIEVEIEGKAQRPQNVEELFIPANALLRQPCRNAVFHNGVCTVFISVWVFFFFAMYLFAAPQTQALFMLYVHRFEDSNT